MLARYNLNWDRLDILDLFETLVRNYLHSQIVKPAFLHILWLFLTSFIIIYTSLLDSVTYSPGYTLKIPKIWKNEFFDPPFFFERKVIYGHMMVILIALGELYYISFSYSVFLDLRTFLVQKKNTIFDPILWHKIL